MDSEIKNWQSTRGDDEIGKNAEIYESKAG